MKKGEKRKYEGKRMENIACHKLTEKCSRFNKCSAPLCPLDREVERRVYLEGEPTCRFDFERLTAIAGDRFEERYRRFIRVSLNKEARFRPLKKNYSSKKKWAGDEHLKIESFINQD